MLRHIVLVTFKPEADAEARAAWRDAVIAMCEASAEVLSFTLGANVGSGANHHDWALVADFAVTASFRRYIDSDRHRADVQDHARRVADRPAAVRQEH